MRMTIIIDLDGAAFGDEPADEVLSILGDIDDRVRARLTASPDEFRESLDGARLRDFNGNTCGGITITEEEA